MRVVFISGPFRAGNAWDIEQNIRRAEQLALEVWRLGAAAVCPHTNTRFFQGAADDDVWLDGYLEILKRCDALILTSGWQGSSGTIKERDCALDEGIPVFSSLVHLKMWLNKDVKEL